MLLKLLRFLFFLKGNYQIACNVLLSKVKLLRARVHSSGTKICSIESSNKWNYSFLCIKHFILFESQFQQVKMAEQFTIFSASFSPDDSLQRLINHNDLSCRVGDLDGNLVTSSKLLAASLGTLVTTCNWRAAKPIKVNTVFLKMLSCILQSYT